MDFILRKWLKMNFSKPGMFSWKKSIQNNKFPIKEANRGESVYSKVAMKWNREILDRRDQFTARVFNCQLVQRAKLSRWSVNHWPQILSSPIRRKAPGVKYPEKAERRTDRMAVVRSAGYNGGCEIGRVEWRLWDRPGRMAAVRSAR